MKRISFIFALITTSLVAMAANTNPSDTVFMIKPVDVVGTLNQNLSIPMSVISAQKIEFSFPNTAADILSKTPGVSLSRDGVWATSVNVRGFSEQRLLFSMNGVRMQTSSDIAAALSTVDLGDVEKIELIKGASSVIYGSGAMGGIVNFVTARPGYSDKTKVDARFETGFSTVNTLWTNHFNVNIHKKLWYIGLAGSYRTAGDIRTPKQKMDSTQFNDASWSIHAGVKYSADKEILIDYQHYHAWNAGLPGVNSIAYTASARYKKVNRDLINAEYIIRNINDYLTRLSVKVYNQSIDREVEILGNQKTFPKTRVLPNSSNNTFGAKLNTNWELEENQDLVLGAECWQRKTETIRLKQIIKSDSVFYVTGELPLPKATQVNAGAYAFYSWKVIPEKFNIHAGGRFDYYITKNDSANSPLYYYKANANGITNLSFTKKNYFVDGNKPEVGYAAQIDFQFLPAKYHSLSASFGNSYRVASLEERFKYIELGTKTTVGNPDLKPERSMSVNLNYNFCKPGFYIKTDLYYNLMSDMIAEKTATFQGKSVYQMTNVGKALLTGGELEAMWNVNPYIGFQNSISYTYTFDADTQGALPQIPPMNGIFSFLFDSHYYVGGSLSALWAANQDYVASNEKTTPGHVIFNTEFHTSTIPTGTTQMQFFAGIDNMFNTAYYNHLATTRNGGVRYYEPGVSFWLKARWIL